MCEICENQSSVAADKYVLDPANLGPEFAAAAEGAASTPGAIVPVEPESRTTLGEPVCPACGLFYDGTIAMDGQRVRCRRYRCRRRFVVHARRVVEYTTRLVADKVARDQGEAVRSPLP